MPALGWADFDNGDVVDEDVPDARAELGRLVSVDVGDFGTDFLEPVGGLLELGFQGGESCPVVVLVLQGVSVRVDLLGFHGLQAFDGYAEFCLLGFEPTGSMTGRARPGCGR